MTCTSKDPVLVVLQLTGGNDYMNTVVPYGDPLYYESRPTVNVSPDRVLPLDDKVGFNPTLAPIKDLYDRGDVAVVHGVGYANPNRSHFRSMDIWHTCEPDKIGTEGWLGKVIRDLDPHAENVLTGVNFGRGLPRAMALPGVPVASVAVLENYGLLTAIPQEEARARALDVFARMYTPAMGTGPTMDYLGQTGLDALKGADILRTAPERYESTIEYGDYAIAQNLKAISQVLLADLGDAGLLHPARRIRYPRRRNSGPYPALDRVVRGYFLLLRRPAGAQRGGPGGDAGLHRVWAAGEGQRFRHRPRLRRPVHGNGRPGQGRPVQPVPINA